MYFLFILMRFYSKGVFQCFGNGNHFFSGACFSQIGHDNFDNSVGIGIQHFTQILLLCFVQFPYKWRKLDEAQKEDLSKVLDAYSDRIIKVIMSNLRKASTREEMISITKTLKDSFTIEPCLLYTSPSPRDGLLSRMPSSA